MKALVYTGKETLAYKDVAQPTPHNDEALMRVHYTGICGSDMHAYHGADARRPAPLILGHEIAGVIETEATGEHRRVIVNPLVTCQTCAHCLNKQENICQKREIISMPPREGGFAEYVIVPKTNLVTVPDHIPLERAALCEPIACGWHATRKCRDYLGQTQFHQSRALVIGGGAIGVGAALSLRAQGISDITLVDPAPHRRAFLSNAFDFTILSPDQLPENHLYHCVFDCVGIVATRKTASQYACEGGIIAHIGLGSGEGGLDTRRMTLQEIAFIGTYTYTMQDFIETAEAIFQGRLGALDWTEVYPLEQGARAFAALHAGAVDASKILLTPLLSPH